MKRWPRTLLRYARAISRTAVVLLALPLLPACSRTDQLVELSPPAPVRPLPARAAQRVRVLVKENYSGGWIEGARQGEGLSLRVEGTDILLFDREQRPVALARGFRFHPADGRMLSLDGTAYRGLLDVFINPQGQSVVVNQLPLEEYLRGVVPLELGPDLFPDLEALKAQAVAARTYTVDGRRRHAEQGFDHYADQRSQVYRGMAHEHPLTDQALTETHGRVATFNGKLITAYYSSTCGGRTAHFQTSFEGEPIPYLIGGVECPDDFSKYHRWERELFPQQLKDSIDRYALVGRLKAIRLLTRDQWGRIVQAELEGEAGQKVIAGSALRFALGLPSAWITALEPQNDQRGLMVKLTVRGRGFGHGVGLCQTGAVALARTGHDYQQILTRYYSGIGLVQLY